LYWLEIIKELNYLKEEILSPEMKETDELTAIFTSSLKTMNNKMKGN